MIDIHSHILPKVDDGSIDIDMSISMAKQYVENGISKVIATPHFIEKSFNSDTKTNRLVLQYLKQELDRSNIPLEVYLGNEIYISLTMIDDISKGKAATLNDSRYVLMELPMNDIPIYLDSIIYELLLKGFTPILAHPERNSLIKEDPNILYRYIKRGVLAQLNLPSIEGLYGKSVQDCANILLKHQMIHFVGSDAHTNRTRSPNVGEALDKLRKVLDDDTFHRLTSINGQHIIDNKEITIKEPLKVTKKKNIFSFIRGQLLNK